MSIEERIEQLKLCAETIIDNAEAIVKGIEYPIETKVVINIPAHQTLTITLEQETYSKKVLGHIVPKK